MALASLLALAGSAALVAGPWTTGLDPTKHVYPATVWLLVIWTVGHVVLGVLMHGYCLARRLAGRMTSRYDVDIVNTALYWHFATLTAVITVAVIAGFPLVA
jgi:cytochrome c oxidase subunit I+III